MPLNIKSLQSPPPQVYCEAVMSIQPNGEWIEVDQRPISMERASAISIDEP